MKFVFPFALLIVAAEAARMTTCEKASKCFDVTVEHMETNYCSAEVIHGADRNLVAGRLGDCTYKICMVFDFSKPGCTKAEHEKITNSCVADDTKCATGGFDFSGNTLVSQIPNNFKTCKLVNEGGGAMFTYRDQKIDTNLPEDYSDVFTTVESAYCMQASDISSYQSCTTVGANKETLWSFTAPYSCPTPPTPGGGSFGDPHIKRWNGKVYDFHGACDLVLIKSAMIAGKLPVDVHVRTTMVEDVWSQIESVALRVGEDQLQIDLDAFYWNGEQVAAEAFPLQTEHFTVRKTLALDRKQRSIDGYMVEFNDESHIAVKKISDFLNVAVSGSEQDFGASEGLMGDYSMGKLYSRQGDRIRDYEEMALEWQVHPDHDPILFTEARYPQLPEAGCVLPDGAKMGRRRMRLDGDSELMAEAHEACARHSDEHFDACVEDVMLTGDIALADAW